MACQVQHCLFVCRTQEERSARPHLVVERNIKCIPLLLRPVLHLVQVVLQALCTVGCCGAPICVLGKLLCACNNERTAGVCNTALLLKEFACVQVERGGMRENASGLTLVSSGSSTTTTCRARGGGGHEGMVMHARASCAHEALRERAACKHTTWREGQQQLGQQQQRQPHLVV